MIQFDAAPAVPRSYKRLKVLSINEIGFAAARGYIELLVDPSSKVTRRGVDTCETMPPNGGDKIWQNRMFLIWLCYIYENFFVIMEPLSAIEELILEFHGLGLADSPGYRLASLYAGAGGFPTPTLKDRLFHINELFVFYENANSILSVME